MRHSHQLPSALSRFNEVVAPLRPFPALLLDYDGTLAPIVDDPDDAAPLPGVIPLLRRLVARIPVAVVSGRGLDDLVPRIGVDGVAHAGSHGFEILTADGKRFHPFPDATASLEEVAAELRAIARATPGSRVEDKRFALALHLRGVAASPSHRALERTRALAAERALRCTHGREVVELRPSVEWDKGHTVRWFLDRWTAAGRGGGALYIGDDITDEDALAAVHELRGTGVLVRTPEPRLTSAHWVLEDPVEVREFLGHLAGALEREPTLAG